MKSAAAKAPAPTVDYEQPVVFPAPQHGVAFADPAPVDFALPPDIVLDPFGRFYCFVCKVVVPRGEANLVQHVEGKRHDANNKRIANLGLKAAFKRKVLDAAASARVDVELVRPSLAASAAAQGPPGQATVKAPKAPKAPKKAKPSPPVPLAASPAALPDRTKLAANAAREERVARAAVLRNVDFDKRSFVTSLIADDDDSDREMQSDDDNEGAHENARICTSAKGRESAFGPLLFKAPEGPDYFLHSMAEETEATDRATSLRALLKAPASERSSAVGTESTPADTSATPLQTVVDAKDLSSFISIATSTGVASNAKSGDTETAKGLGLGAEGETEIKASDDKAAEASGGSDINADGETDAGEPELPPWLFGADAIYNVKYAADSTLALHYEILEFSRFVSPTADEIDARSQMVITIESIINSLWPGARIEIFGSYATGLYLPTSDIDVCVMGSPKGGDISEFYELAQAIRNVKDFARRVNVIKARVPLVKIIDRENNVQCDISFARENGVQNVPVIKSYLENYPALRPLLLVIKCFLQQRSLNEVFTGGLGSYSVLLLVVSHLQMLRYNFPGSKANLGAVLMQFFHLYGRAFNCCLAGIRVKDNGCYYDKVEKYQTPPGDTLRFSIEDPNDETNELGRNSYAASRVRKAFGNASMSLYNWRRDNPACALTPLSTILQPNDSALLKRRAAVRSDLKLRNVTSLREAIIVSLSEATKARMKAHRTGDVFAAAAAATGARGPRELNQSGQFGPQRTRGSRPRDTVGDPRESRDPRANKRRRSGRSGPIGGEPFAREYVDPTVYNHTNHGYRGDGVGGPAAYGANGVASNYGPSVRAGYAANQLGYGTGGPLTFGADSYGTGAQFSTQQHPPPQAPGLIQQQQYGMDVTAGAQHYGQAQPYSAAGQVPPTVPMGYMPPPQQQPQQPPHLQHRGNHHSMYDRGHNPQWVYRGRGNNGGGGPHGGRRN